MGGASVKSFKCKNCGASISYNASEQGLHCDFCSSIYVTENQSADAPSTGQTRISPVVVDENKARRLFMEWRGSRAVEAFYRELFKGVRL